MNRHLLSCTCLLLCTHLLCLAQSDSASLYGRINRLPDKFFSGLNDRAQRLQTRMQRQTASYLHRLEARERKLQRRIARKDTALAKELFGDTHAVYAGLSTQLNEPPNPFREAYSGRLDSLKTGLQFMRHQLPAGRYQQLLQQYSSLQGQLNQTDRINKLLQERQQLLFNRLQQTPYAHALSRLREKVYAYRAQMDAYKRTWEDPKALEGQLTSLLAQSLSFREFFGGQSDLGAVFNLRRSSGGALSTPGLQTRAGLDQFVRNNMGAGLDLQSQVSNNLPASGIAGELESRMNGLQQQGIGKEMAMPDYKPEEQRNKRLGNRLEYGTTIQTAPSSSFFPVTSDVGVSIGYRISQNSVAGVGLSGKIGWGKNISNLRVTGEGMAVRSFTDIRVKGAWWISGGLEYNYQQAFSDMRYLQHLQNWQPGGLLGISRIIPMGTGGKKKYRMQLLYDFLYRSAVPATQPFKFRVGYSL